MELKLKDWVILKTGDLLTFEVLVQTWKKAPEMEAAQMSQLVEVPEQVLRLHLHKTHSLVFLLQQKEQKILESPINKQRPRLEAANPNLATSPTPSHICIIIFNNLRENPQLNLGYDT